MKKILIINTTLNKGGAARIAYDLFEKTNNGFDISFAYGRGEKDSNLKTFYFGNKIEMFIHIFLVRFLGLEGFGTYFSTRKLINFIKKEKFDLINLHNLHGYYLNFLLLLDFIKKSNIPVIYTVHDEWPITWLPAHSLGCDHCKTGQGKCQNTYKYPKNYFPLFLKYMLKKKKEMFSGDLKMSIICPSIWLKQNIENSFLNKFKINIIPNGIDTDIFKPVLNKESLRIKYNLPVDKKIVLFSASNLNDKNKGIGHIIDAAKLLNNENLFFVGLGNGEIKEVPNLITLGYIYDRDKLTEIYSLSDIFCFASSVETFLLSAAEALSCGVPVVGFDLPVVRELINTNVGILTKNDSKSLCEEICKLAGDKDRMITLGQKGRKIIMANYSKKTFLEEYRKIYSNTKP
jgi:putative colanic acid biosynthesis glycosyltransferase